MPKRLSLDGPNAILYNVKYTPHFAPWRHDTEKLWPGSIHAAKLMDDYQNMQHDTLRWRVIANTAVRELPKTVQRERLRRRVQESIRRALLEAGYDCQGKVVRQTQRVEKPQKHDLKGTMEIFCVVRAGLDRDYWAIVGRARKVVSAIIERNYAIRASGKSSKKEWEWWNEEIKVSDPVGTKRPAD